MSKITLSKQEPPQNTRQPRTPNIKYAGVYQYVAANPNEWLKIEPLNKFEVSSIRNYYTQRRVKVNTRLVKSGDHYALYIRWNKEETE